MIEYKMNNEMKIVIRLARNTRRRDNLILDKEDLEIELTKLYKSLMLIELLENRTRYAWI